MHERLPSAAADPRPHDLLWVAAAPDLVPVDALPAWATAGWVRAAPVVVRRAPIDGDRVPVGLRGMARHQRCAARVARDRVVRTVTPQEIARRVSNDARLSAATLPCVRTLARLARMLDHSALVWGITGSVGFTLASGVDVLRPDSDLDLLVQAPDRSDADALRALGRALNGAQGEAASRVDIQVETRGGAFALDEWLRTGQTVLLKTARGPVLSDDPWGVDKGCMAGTDALRSA